MAVSRLFGAQLSSLAASVRDGSSDRPISLKRKNPTTDIPIKHIIEQTQSHNRRLQTQDLWAEHDRGQEKNEEKKKSTNYRTIENDELDSSRDTNSYELSRLQAERERILFKERQKQRMDDSWDNTRVSSYNDEELSKKQKKEEINVEDDSEEDEDSSDQSLDDSKRKSSKSGKRKSSNKKEKKKKKKERTKKKIRKKK